MWMSLYIWLHIYQGFEGPRCWMHLHGLGFKQIQQHVKQNVLYSPDVLCSLIWIQNKKTEHNGKLMRTRSLTMCVTLRLVTTYFVVFNHCFVLGYPTGGTTVDVACVGRVCPFESTSMLLKVLSLWYINPLIFCWSTSSLED